MHVEVRGRNLPVTEPLQLYVDKRFSRLARLFTRDCVIDVELAIERNPRIADSQVAEATVLTRGTTMRARHADADMYAAIDGLADRVRRQIADLHDRRFVRKPHHAVKPSTAIPPDAGLQAAG
jgi:putative sigma-54 modulation protein